MAWSMLVVALGASFLSSACACSSFELNTSHGFKVLGHTMEYGKLMNSPNWVLFTTPTKSEVFLNNVSTVKAWAAPHSQKNPEALNPEPAEPWHTLVQPARQSLGCWELASSRIMLMV